MKFKLILTGALSALLLNGCASSSSSYDYSNVDPSLTKDEANFFSESGWTACAVGAGVGTLACILRGGDSSDMLTCAAIALPAGCGLFMGGNYLLDELRVNYKTKEAQLDHMTSLVKQDNEKLRTLNSSVAELLDEDRRELARMERELADGSISADDLRYRLNDIDDNINYYNKSIAVVQDRLKTYESTRNQLLSDGKTLSAADKESLMALNQEIDDMKAALEEANAASLAYAQLRNGIHAVGAA